MKGLKTLLRPSSIFVTGDRYRPQWTFAGRCYEDSAGKIARDQGR